MRRPQPWSGLGRWLQQNPDARGWEMLREIQFQPDRDHPGVPGHRRDGVLVLHDAVSPNRECQSGRCQHHRRNAPIRGNLSGSKGLSALCGWGLGKAEPFPMRLLPQRPDRPATVQTSPGGTPIHAKSLALAWAARYLAPITSIADCFGGGLAGPLFFVLGPLFDHRTTSA